MATETLSPYKPKVTISKELSAQISYLHDQCPKKKEWSGLLIYEVLKGSINDLENLEIKAHAVFPMDFGDATFTSFEASDSWLSAFSQFPQIDPLTPTPGWYIGKIHSHHDMTVFHSTVDKADLHDTAPNLPMFLSLIVNYEVSTDCELAIAVEAEEKIVTTIEWKLKGWTDKKIENKTETPATKRVYVMKCIVDYEQEDWFKAQIEVVRASKRQPVYTGYAPPYTSPGYQQPKYNHGGQGPKDYGFHKNKFGSKKQRKKNKNKFINSTDIKGALPGALEKNYTQKTYQRMLAEASDLFTLGLGHTMAPADALRKIDLDLGMYNKGDYQKAFVYFFAEVWYPINFAYHATNVDADEIEVIEALRDLLRCHKSMWIETVITQALNELEVMLIALNAKEEEEEDDAQFVLQMS